jgi:hypothetical protein
MGTIILMPIILMGAYRCRPTGTRPHPDPTQRNKIVNANIYLQNERRPRNSYYGEILTPGRTDKKINKNDEKEENASQISQSRRQPKLGYHGTKIRPGLRH